MTRIVVDQRDRGEGLAAVQSVFKSIHALRPEIAARIEAAQRSLYVDGTLSERLREVVRLRIGFHNQCRTCMAVRYAPDAVPEDLVCSLEHPEESEDLSDGERVAIRFADLFATNHLAIGDEIYAQLRSHFDEGEIVELGFLCALFVGMGRLAATWNVTDSLPGSFRDSPGTVTPWGHRATLEFRR